MSSLLMDLKTTIPCYYPGTPEGLTFKNEGDRFVLLIAHSEGKIDIEQIKINKREFQTIMLDCTNFETENEIRRTLKENTGKNKITRLFLTGSPSLDFTFDIDLLTKEHETDYFYLKIKDDVHIPQDLTEDETIRGTFIRLIKSEIGKEENEYCLQRRSTVKARFLSALLPRENELAETPPQANGA